MITVRPAVADDAEALNVLRTVVYPFLVRSAAAQRRLMAVPSPRERGESWVAERDGRIVGYGFARLIISTTEPGAAAVGLHVHPDARGHGVGAALRTVATAHLREIDAVRVRAWVRDDALEYARRHGYTPSREVRYSGVDPRSVSPVPDLPGDVVLVPVSALRPEDVHEADVITSSDEPGDMRVDARAYDDWRREIWDSPDLDRDVSVAALVEGRIASYTLVEIDGERAWSGMTGTLPAHRGRGLAKLVKSVALRAAVARGVVSAFTANDEANGGMLAVNRWLGYRPVAAQWSCIAILREP